MTDLSLPGRVLWSAGPPIVRGLARLLYSLSVDYQTEVPPPPYVVAANHYSHLDPPIVGAVIGLPVRFLAVDELQGNSAVLDKVLDWSGAIALPRGSVPLTAMRTAIRVLEHGGVVGVFPEGARVEKWGMRRPKKGAAWLALRTGVPLIPVAVQGTDLAFDIDNRWHRAQIKVTVGPPLTDSSMVSLTRAWTDWTAACINRDAREPRPSEG